MRNKKILFILIPVLVVALVLIAGIVFIVLNSSPEKIFEHSISKVFDVFENSEDFSTVRGKMDLTASVESDDEEVQAVNDMLEGSSIGLDMQVDTKNIVINEALNVTFNNESLLNVSILLQDEKGYVYLPDWLNKYLQIAEEELDYSKLTEAYDKAATLDRDALTEAVKEELIKVVTAQELVQEKTTLILDGQETKVTASILSLKDAQINTFYSGLFNNLRQNEKFQVALGVYKEEVLDAMDEMLQEMGDAEDVEFAFTIYTKGFLNEFAGVTAKAVDTSYGDIMAVELLKNSDEKYEFKAYDEYDGEREEVLKVVVEDKKESKDKGTATITITADGEELVLLYNYETKGDQTSFVLSTEIEGVKFAISGNAVENGNNIKGNLVIAAQDESFGKVNLKLVYDFTYDVQILKTDTQNAVLIDELSEEDQTTLMTNLQNSPLYQLIGESGAFDSGIENLNNKPEVTYDGYTIMYSVPEGFELSEYSSVDDKMYMDENMNSINSAIENDSVDTYMRGLDDEYVLTSSFYKNQKISETKTYAVNGKEYKFRTITYNDDFGSYAKIYFAYELDDKNCYVVEVESQGAISMEIIKQFLDVTVEKESLQNTINEAELFLNSNQM